MPSLEQGEDEAASLGVSDLQGLPALESSLEIVELPFLSPNHPLAAALAEVEEERLQEALVDPAAPAEARLTAQRFIYERTRKQEEQLRHEQVTLKHGVVVVRASRRGSAEGGARNSATHPSKLRVGDVVVRGADWRQGDEDGGAGALGTVRPSISASRWPRLASRPATYSQYAALP